MKKNILFIFVAVLSAFMVGCKKNSAKSQLSSIVNNLNDSMPMKISNDVLCTKIVMENNKMTYHCSVGTDYMNKLNIAKTRSSHITNIKSEGMQKLAGNLAKEEVTLSYLYTDSITTVIFDISPKEISELVPTAKVEEAAEAASEESK